MILTKHARERMAEMGLTEAQVAEVLSAPEVSWTGENGRNSRPGGAPATTAKRGPLTVVWFPAAERDDKVVVTILWNRPDRYSRDN
jgi:hypothetical protein